MYDILQIVGAVLILVPFTLAQMGRLPVTAVSYLVLNLIGAIVLAVLAAVDEQWGFLLLETCWSAVAAWGLLAHGRGGDPAPAG
jgi:hypothetical protein